MTWPNQRSWRCSKRCSAESIIVARWRTSSVYGFSCATSGRLECFVVNGYDGLRAGVRGCGWRILDGQVDWMLSMWLWFAGESCWTDLSQTCVWGCRRSRLSELLSSVERCTAMNDGCQAGDGWGLEDKNLRVFFVLMTVDWRRRRCWRVHSAITKGGSNESEGLAVSRNPRQQMHVQDSQVILHAVVFR